LKILRVGDPHAKVGNLEEMKKLVLFIVEQAKLHKADRIELLGDLFHTHNVIRLEVIEFWTWALDLLSQTCETIVLVGNHDQSGDYNSTFSSLSSFALMNKKNLTIIDKPTLLGTYGYIPYTHNDDNFVAMAHKLADSGANILVCHQTIEGSKYESGIYAPDGIPTGEWSERFIHVISGHIHSEQSFGNIIYPGTARWDTVTDANRRKGVWLYHHSSGDAGNGGSSSETERRPEPISSGSEITRSQNGRIQSAHFISTENVCSPIRLIEWHEGDPKPELWGPNDRVSVELIGSSAWIANEKERLKGTCSIKTTITDASKKVVRKTGANFECFMKDLFVSTMDKEKLMKYAKEIGIV
jgi:DNA repair exonuclease SbcCD nuclease subunit